MRNNQPVVDVEIKFPEDPNAKIISVTDAHADLRQLIFLENK